MFCLSVEWRPSYIKFQLTWYKLWLRKLSKDSWWSSTPPPPPTGENYLHRESRAEIKTLSSIALTHHTHKHSPTLFPRTAPSYQSTLLPRLGDKNEYPRDLAKFGAREHEIPHRLWREEDRSPTDANNVHSKENHTWPYHHQSMYHHHQCIVSQIAWTTFPQKNKQTNKQNLQSSAIIK